MDETTVATAVDGETAAAEPSSDTIGGALDGGSADLIGRGAKMAAQMT